MFNEIHYWERLFEIPHYVSEVYQRREELRTMRESVLLVVRDYNRSAKHSHLHLHCISLYDTPVRVGESLLS